MKRLSVIALLASAIAFTACKKEDKNNKPAPTEAAKPGAAPTTATGTEPAKPADPAPAGDVAPTGDPAPTGAAPSDDEFEGMMNKAVAMFEAMGKAVEDAGDDCGKAADGLGKVMDDNKAFMETAKKMESDAAFKAKADEWMKGHMEQVMAPMMKMATLGQKCATDAKFAEVMKRFEDMSK